MARNALPVIAALVATMVSTSVEAAGWKGLFDVEARSAQLATPQYAALRRACLATPIDSKWKRLKPIAGLTTTEGYGSDNKAEDFSWAVMVLSGRTLAGDRTARQSLTELLMRWASANAFGETEEVHDAYYALKRQLLPLSVAYATLEPGLAADEAQTLRDWIDPLVRRIDKVFDGDVDRNNHRTLADSVLAVWGSVTGDRALLDKGIARYDATLAETRADGTLELEARRGSRALWYQRQTLSSLVVLAETARGSGIDLYNHSSETGQSLATLIGAMMNGLSSPSVVLVYSAENHIPGPEKDFLKLDLGFLEKRGHGRHYMAWAEALASGEKGLAYDRLHRLFDLEIAKQRPLIDEFAGGNATCFWGQP
jgi:poly(beta-D-mannuronate) lyase